MFIFSNKSINKYTSNLLVHITINDFFYASLLMDVVILVLLHLKYLLHLKIFFLVNLYIKMLTLSKIFSLKQIYRLFK